MPQPATDDATPAPHTRRHANNAEIRHVSSRDAKLSRRYWGSLYLHLDLVQTAEHVHLETPTVRWRMDGLVDGMGGWLGGWLDGWLNGYIDVCMYVCMYRMYARAYFCSIKRPESSRACKL